jgi:hypothetical protein
MDKNPLDKGIIAKNLKGIGTVTRKMILERAHQLALLSGRPPSLVSEADFDEARRELAGDYDPDSRQQAIESIPESERWDPVPGSEGKMDPEPPDEESDSEGRNESAQLVEEGVQEAEHDQMLKAEESEEEAEKRDRQDG